MNERLPVRTSPESTTFAERLDGCSRRTTLALIAGLCFMVYSGLLLGVVRVWGWMSVHLSTVELLGVVAGLVLAGRIYLRIREAARIKMWTFVSGWILL